MNAREWKDAMGDLIDGVEQQVSASAPKSATKLKEFRSLVSSQRTAAARQHFESKLEEFLQSAPHLRDAAWRHLTPIADAALQRSAKALKEADQILTARRMSRQQHK
jgi:hypothetical protein